MVGITRYSYAHTSKNDKVHKDSKTKKIDQKNIFFGRFSKKTSGEYCQKLHRKFHRNRKIGKWRNRVPKVCWRKKKYASINDDIWILIGLDPKGISGFCKRLYILLDEVNNYKTHLIGEINELKFERKMTLDVYEATCYRV